MVCLSGATPLLPRLKLLGALTPTPDTTTQASADAAVRALITSAKPITEMILFIPFSFSAPISVDERSYLGPSKPINPRTATLSTIFVSRATRRLFGLAV
jgi:hypothetical protein